MSAGRAVWKIVVKDHGTFWFRTKTEAEFVGSHYFHAEVVRVPVGCYVDTQQLIEFIRVNFSC
jgi:hypothetical protein